MKAAPLFDDTVGVGVSNKNPKEVIILRCLKDTSIDSRGHVGKTDMSTVAKIHISDTLCDVMKPCTLR